MRLNQRFRRLAFAQVLLGIVSFCVAEPNPGLLLVFGALAVLSWYVTEGPGGRPLPRWSINLASLVAVAWLMLDLFSWEGHVVVAMGHFTICLQVLLLYAHKTNREYAQLLVLSLMTMIGASILSVTMLYGVMLAAYCALGLVTLLHFHLKVSWDHVTDVTRAAAPAGEMVIPPKPLFGRGHQWHLRFLTVAIGFVCVAVAVAVFVTTPRRGDRPPTGETATAMAQTQAGFNTSVHLGSSPRNEGSKEPVLNMSVRLHGHNVVHNEGDSWLLRGAALDTYQPGNHTWVRSAEASGIDRAFNLGDQGMHLLDLAEDKAYFEARVTLRQSGFRVLFTVFPTSHIQSENFSSVIYNELDQQLAAAEMVPGAVIYTLRWPLSHSTPGLQASTPLRVSEDLAARYARGWPHRGGERIRNHALSIIRERGLDRDPEADYSPYDDRIVQVLAEYLRTGFTYSLQNPPVPRGSDPVVEFLFNTRAGHCELFAAGMAAMTRSIGIPARVITGYRASEYNRIGGYYVVRQANAHAWTEVHLGPERGWRVLDATPPEQVHAVQFVSRTWLTTLRELYEVVEYEWIRSVVAYDQRSRARVMNEIRDSIGRPDDRGTWLGQVVGFVRDLRDIWQLDRLNYTLIFIILILLALAVASLVRTVVLRRRRLAALQLTALPRAQRRGLASRLRFYLQMLEMLERHGYVRPSWQSPFGFAQELAEAHPMKFDPVVALTEIFYEIRFGRRMMDDPRKQRIKAHLKQLEHALSGR
jgi:hypothetical protein